MGARELDQFDRLPDGIPLAFAQAMNGMQLSVDLGVAPPISGGQSRDELIAFARYCAARITKDLAVVSGWELFLIGGLDGQAEAVVRAHLGATVVEAHAHGCDPAVAIWDAMCQVEEPLRRAAATSSPI